MRLLVFMSLMMSILPGLAFGASDVEEKVEKAIEALKTTCYEARMIILDQYDENREQKVLIYHVAPELYRVAPLIDGDPGNIYYIENAVELVRVENDTVETMPLRRFSTNDQLTIKFLNDLAKHAGTTVLEGIVGDNNYNVWVLLQEETSAKPYTITVGLDQFNYFPVFLLVMDGEGKRRVYYEMEAIRYDQSCNINDGWFQIPEQASQNVAQSLTPEIGLMNAKRVAEAEFEHLPLFPNWLPADYVLESISKMGYGAETDDGATDKLVFQLEVFGPRGELLSIFQTLAGKDVDLAPNEFFQVENKGHLLTRINGWIVAVLGADLSDDQLKMVAENLGEAPDLVKGILNRTKARDLVLQDAMDNADK